MEQPTNLFELQIDQPSINYLSETARWSRFLAILGIIVCGLFVIGGFFLGSLLATMMSGVGETGMSSAISIFFSCSIIFTALILFLPSFYLLKFSSKMRKAINNNDQSIMTDSLKNLKSFFKFWGILTIVYLSLWLLSVIFSIAGAMMGRH
jgi:hypothetical protein